MENVLNHLLKSSRRRLLAVVVIGTFIALATWLAVSLLRPMPQRTVAMAIYPEGSLNAELVKRYRDILARDGVDLKLEPSAGAVEAIARLKDPRFETSIALIPSGLTTGRDSPQLVTLGTLFYQPLWIFSRRRPVQDRGHARDFRISIGPEGSSSHAISLSLLGRAGIIDRKSATVLSLTPSDSAEKLTHGEIDMAIFLDGWESPVVQGLLKSTDVKLESVVRADAFVALHPYLNKLVLPAGVVDMAEPRPATDVVLIAPKSSLVVRKGLHPAIQYLLLEAAEEIHSPPRMFQSDGQFPAGESIDLPLSPYALEFYKSGPPFLQRHLPFWLAVFLEQPLVWIIPLLAILFPLMRVAPSIYDWAEKRRIYRLYSELKRLEDEVSFAAPGSTRQDLVERLNELKCRASRLSVPTPFKPLVYALRLHIDMVRREIQKSVTS